jgi:NitT/TauT family transport system substrate-binding protein
MTCKDHRTQSSEHRRRKDGRKAVTLGETMITVRPNRRLRRSVASAAVLFIAIGATSCGSDDDASSSATDAPQETTAEPAETTPTTEASETTEAPDTTDATATTDAPETTDEPDTTDAGVPAGDCDAEPLAERGKVIIALSAPLEYAATLLFAQEYGEFDKDNLDVEIQITQDSLTAMSAGQIDAAWGAPSAGLINAIASGLPMKWVAGNYTSPPESLSGLWMRKDVVGDPVDLAKLAGSTTANSQTGGVVTYFMDTLLEGTGVTIDQLIFEKLAPADTLAALENGAIDGAWLIDPLYKQVENNPDMIFAGTQPEGEVGGGMIYGESLLDPSNKDVGVAMLRAMCRATQTYLQPGYKDDPEIVALLAELGGIPVEQVTASGELVFDMRISDGLATRMQETWTQLGLLESGSPLPEDEVTDLSFIEAIGIS